jgi:hypothetical protein
MDCFYKNNSASSLHWITPSGQVLLALSHVIISSETMLYITWIFFKKMRGREPEEKGGGVGEERERERERGEQVSIISALWGPTCTRTY